MGLLHPPDRGLAPRTLVRALKNTFSLARSSPGSSPTPESMPPEGPPPHDATHTHRAEAARRPGGHDNWLHPGLSRSRPLEVPQALEHPGLVAAPPPLAAGRRRACRAISSVFSPKPHGGFVTPRLRSPGTSSGRARPVRALRQHQMTYESSGLEGRTLPSR